MKNPSIKAWPVAIADLISRKPRLHHLSYEARNEGLVKGMSLQQAKRYCPQLKVYPLNFKLEHDGVSALSKIVSSFSPLWEPCQGGAFFLDLTGTEKLWGKGKVIGGKLERSIEHKFDLKCSIGIASNKLVSRIAGMKGELGEVLEVEAGHEAKYISSFSSSLLPCVRGTKLVQSLKDLDLFQIGQIRKMSTFFLKRLFGGFAYRLKQESKGIDPSPVFLPNQSDVVEEIIWLDEEENDDLILLSHLHYLLEKISFRLRASSRVAKCLSFWFLYSDGKDCRTSLTKAQASCWEFDWEEEIEKRFYHIFKRRVSVRAMKLSFRSLSYRGDGQTFMDYLLFPNGEREKNERLLEAVDEIRSKYGWEAMKFGKTI